MPEILSRYREAVDAGLRTALGAGLPMAGMLRYHMGWLDERLQPVSAKAGKGVRPALCLYACEAVGGDWRRALPAAVSLELIHNFSLVHDDIQDGDAERHHRPTVWYLWGYSHGLNAGNAMHVLANQALWKLGDGTQDPAMLLAVSGLLTHACMEMIEGQALDVGFERVQKVSTEEYLRMISKKTGALLEVSLHAGARLGSADTVLVEGMRRYGEAIGKLFQARDDMLGVWGQAEETGKPVASDLHRRKKSLPVVHALQEAPESAAGKAFAAIYRTKDALDEEDIRALLQAMAEMGSREFCQHLAEEEARKALDVLGELPLSPWAKREGAALVMFLLERQF